VATDPSLFDVGIASRFGNTASFNGAANFNGAATFGSAATFNGAAGFGVAPTFATGSAAAAALVNLGIQCGSITMPTAAGGQNSATITFSKAFAAAPKLFFQINYSGAGYTDIYLAPSSLTSTNFVARLYNGSTASRGNIEVFWFAIGTYA
jgi:hypothetical protein